MKNANLLQRVLLGISVLFSAVACASGGGTAGKSAEANKVIYHILKGRKIDKSRVHSEAKIVPSGVAEIGRLQQQEGFAYLKP